MHAEGGRELVCGGNDIFETLSVGRHVVGHAAHNQKLEGIIALCCLKWMIGGGARIETAEEESSDGV
jgi:hypothetical protein